MCAKLLSRVQLFATLWTVACQAPLSMGFSRQEYWSGLPCPPPGDLPNPGTEPMSSTAPTCRRFTPETPGKPCATLPPPTNTQGDALCREAESSAGNSALDLGPWAQVLPPKAQMHTVSFHYCKPHKCPSGSGQRKWEQR